MQTRRPDLIRTGVPPLSLASEVHAIATQRGSEALAPWRRVSPYLLLGTSMRTLCAQENVRVSDAGKRNPIEPRLSARDEFPSPRKDLKRWRG